MIHGLQGHKSKIRRKHTADAVQLRRILHPVSHPYKEGPHVRGNGASTQDAPKDKDKDQIIYHPAEDQSERLPGGFGQPHLAASRPDLLLDGIFFDPYPYLLVVSGVEAPFPLTCGPSLYGCDAGCDILHSCMASAVFSSYSAPAHLKCTKLENNCGARLVIQICE